MSRIYRKDLVCIAGNAMVGRRIALFFVFLFSCYSSIGQTAKKKKEKDAEKVPVFNYVIDDPMDAFGRQPMPEAIMNSVLLPQFTMPRERQLGDTSRIYQFYDGTNVILDPDTLTDYEVVRFVSLVERYTENGHTYRDADGTSKPLPVEKIIFRYDKMGADKWLSVDYSTNKTHYWKEDVNQVVKIDTVRRQQTDGSILVVEYKYYNVSLVR